MIKDITKPDWTQQERTGRIIMIDGILKRAPELGDYGYRTCRFCGGMSLRWDCFPQPNGLPTVSGICLSGCWSFKA